MNWYLDIENYPNNGNWNIFCSRMIDSMIDCMIDCMIDILLDFCRFGMLNRFLLIFALQCWTWLGQCAHTRINRILFNIVVVLTYRQGHRIRLVGLFRCVRRSRNIQHISERCFPIDNLIKPFPIPTDFYAHNYEQFSSHRTIGYGVNKKKTLSSNFTIAPFRLFISRTERIFFFPWITYIDVDSVSSSSSIFAVSAALAQKRYSPLILYKNQFHLPFFDSCIDTNQFPILFHRE